MAFEFKFPDVGEGVHEGKILQLKVKPGDHVRAGDIVAVVETDKVVAEIPAPKDGTIVRLGAAEGQIIHVGETLAEIETGDRSAASSTARKVSVEENAGVVGELELAGDTVMPASGEGLPDTGPDSAPLNPGRRHLLASPVARKLAADLGVDLTSLAGSGPGGRVMKTDVLSAVGDSAKPSSSSSASTPAGSPVTPPSSGVDVEVLGLSTLRKTLARNMEASHTIPAAVVYDQCVIDDLVTFRNQVNEGRESRISFQAFFLKAVAVALTRHPSLNSLYDGIKSEIQRFRDPAIGFAFQTDNGLVVPVLRDLHNLSIKAIDSAMKERIDRGRAGRLTLDDLRGGTFTLTNYGSFAGTYGKPMIMPPQVAILGTGRVHQTPVVKAGAIVPGWVLPLSLVFDHRAVDGAPAAAFLAEVMDLLSHPAKLLVE